MIEQYRELLAPELAAGREREAPGPDLHLLGTASAETAGPPGALFECCSSLNSLPM